jgi:hypothetical protein
MHYNSHFMLYDEYLVMQIVNASDKLTLYKNVIK